MGIVSLAIVAYVTSTQENRDEVSSTLIRFMTEKRYTPLLAAAVVGIPALAAANVYVKMNVPLQPPLFSRTVHPASPSEITVHDKKIDLDAAENPFLKPGAVQYRAEFRKHVENGRKVYYRNCVFCHGDDLSGNGMFVHGLDPIPDQLHRRIDCRTCATRSCSGASPRAGRDFPRKAGRGTSAMPAWEKILKEEEMWEVILFLYDFTGQKPRAREACAQMSARLITRGCVVVLIGVGWPWSRCDR